MKESILKTEIICFCP